MKGEGEAMAGDCKLFICIALWHIIVPYFVNRFFTTGLLLPCVYVPFLMKREFINGAARKRQA